MVIQSLNGIYLHAAWATSPEGEDFSLTEFADATYIGTYSDNSSTESTEPISYNWMLIGDISGVDNGTDDLIDTENAAALASAQAESAQAQTIVNNDNIQSSQDDTDMSTGNPNELIGTNQGTNNWTASAGLTISAQSGTIYNPNDEAVNYLHVECDTAGTNYIAFDASILREKLVELTDDNSFTLSADINMSTVFDMPVMVSDTDGSNIQIDFGVIEPELIPVPEETADGLWVFSKSTADCENEVAVSSQVVLFDLSNMGAGETLDIANLKIEGGALATPWRASLDEVANIANQAYSVANNTQQHFWFQSTGADTGAHITEVDKDTWDLDPSNGGGNLLARSNGVAIRDGLIELATLQQSGMDVNTDDGNGNTVNIAHLGYGPGTDSGGGTTDAPYYSLGTRTGTIGNYSVAEGRNTTAGGFGSHAEGQLTTASGSTSHAEGRETTASGSRSHAEGIDTTASGSGSHAEGDNTTASGTDSHAEGNNTTASGDYSHAQNRYTIAASNYQTALGRFNIEDNSSAYLVIVGNGNSPQARANALTIDWNGNAWTKGTITAENHGTPIGYNNTGSGTKNNFPNNSQTELVGGISVSAGTWLLICRVGFPSNATGRRFACWHNSTTSADYYTSYCSSAAVSGGYTNVQTVMTIQVSGNTTFSVHAFQNSGSSMNVAYNWSITRIA